MNTKHILPVLCCAIGLSGCPAISADITLTNQTTTIELDFAGECSGTGSKTSDYGTTTWTKNTRSATCDVTANWSGNIIPTALIKQRIDEEADGHLSDIKVTALTVKLKGVSFTNAENVNATPPSIDLFSANSAIGSLPFYDLRRENINVLFDQEVTKSFSEDDPVLQAISTALNDGSPLPTSAEVKLSVSLTALQPLQPQSVNPHRFVFTHDFEVSAEGKASL